MNHPKLGTPVDVFLTEHPMTKQLEELNSNHLPGMLWKEEGMQTKDVTPSHTHIIYIYHICGLTPSIKHGAFTGSWLVQIVI